MTESWRTFKFFITGLLIVILLDQFIGISKWSATFLHDDLTQTSMVSSSSMQVPAVMQQAGSNWQAPLWASCKSNTPFSSNGNNNNPNKKLVFVHVFKTAGSSFRRFMDAFGQSCGRSVAIVTECSEVAASTIGSDNEGWSDVKGDLCHVKSFRDRQGLLLGGGGADDHDDDGGSPALPPPTMMTSTLLNDKVDILIGHLPIGVHDDAIYVTFFREPLAKFVSGRLFTHRKEHWNMDEAIAFISKMVKHEVKKNRYYNGYRRYLTTPQQKTETAYIEGDEGHVVDLIEKNLLESKTIVGIVERMGESLALMQSMMDPGLEMTDAFAALDMATPPSNKTGTENKMIRNQSELSTSAIVKVLKEDGELYPLLKEYLKYEFELYEFALALHEEQVESMHLQYGDTFSFAS